jgi:cytochrome P450
MSSTVFKAARAPGPKYLVPGHLVFAFRRRPLDFLSMLARDYGPVARFKIGPQRYFLLSDPEDVRDVLVTHHDNFFKGLALQRAKRLLGEGLLTSEGALHRRQRRLAQPAFHKQRIAAYGSIMVDYGARFSARWRHGETLDMAHEMMRLTLAIIGKTMFDADVEAAADEVGAALTTTMKLFRTLMLPLPFLELIERLPLPSARRFQRAKDQLDAIIYRMIDARRQSGTDRGDLLSMLLLAQDIEGDGGRMSDTQLRDELLTIFLAGHETTANALTWTWYLLSQHPEAEKRLHAEIDEVLADDLPAVEHVAQLRYTGMVLAEAMRLYPPAWILGRFVLNDYEVKGYTIPKGSVILLSQYVIHHDARFFPEPFRFDPERWTPEARAQRPQFSYFPFGGGPRRCIGESFAWLEGLLLLACIARSWRPRLVPGHPVALQPIVTLRPKYGMLMTLERRK